MKLFRRLKYGDKIFIINGNDIEEIRSFSLKRKYR